MVRSDDEGGGQGDRGVNDYLKNEGETHFC